jgi:hypothetical protein
MRATGTSAAPQPDSAQRRDEHDDGSGKKQGRRKRREHPLVLGQRIGGAENERPAANRRFLPRDPDREGAWSTGLEPDLGSEIQRRPWLRSVPRQRVRLRNQDAGFIVGLV